MANGNAAEVTYHRSAVNYSILAYYQNHLCSPTITYHAFRKVWLRLGSSSCLKILK